MEIVRPATQAMRRAATRGRIVRAGSHLFETRGYDETSIRDISAAAGVAARTIYLHFESKAAILLAYFDDWIDDFVAAICAGPPDEDVDAAVARAYAVLDAEGKVDNRTFEEMGGPHPIIELFASSNLDIPGHVLQSWVRAQDVLTEHFAGAERAGHGSVVPRTKAAAIFATWMVVLLSYRDERSGAGTHAGPLHEIAFAALRQFGSGLNPRDSRGAGDQP
ncbi:MAG: TetR/AcrR family transcriptional regulator [Microbacterium pygmaeum]